MDRSIPCDCGADPIFEDGCLSEYQPFGPHREKRLFPEACEKFHSWGLDGLVAKC